jgi:hypothetical protein
MTKASGLLPWICVLLLSTASWGAEQVGPGDRMPLLAGKDQHGAAFEMSSAVKVVLISFDMATGKQANGYLADQGAGFLDRHGAVYVANVHGMPGIGRFFALRKMRRYPHRIVLSEQEQALDPFPRSDGSVTVVRLGADDRIAAVDFWNPAQEALQQYLE